MTVIEAKTAHDGPDGQGKRHRFHDVNDLVVGKRCGQLIGDLVDEGLHPSEGPNSESAVHHLAIARVLRWIVGTEGRRIGIALSTECLNLRLDLRRR